MTDEEYKNKKERRSWLKELTMPYRYSVTYKPAPEITKLLMEFEALTKELVTERERRERTGELT